jgi:hypothetical protein
MVDPTRGNVPHLPSPSGSFGTQDALVPHEADMEPDDLDVSLDSSLDEDLDDAEWFDDMLMATDDPDALPEYPPRWRVGTLTGILLLVTPVVLLLGFGFGAVTLWSADAVLSEVPEPAPAAAVVRPARVESAPVQPAEPEVAPPPVEVAPVAASAPEVEVVRVAAPPVETPPAETPPVDEPSEPASVWSTLPEGDAPPATDDAEPAEPAPVVAAEPAVAPPVQDAGAAEVPAAEPQDEAPRRGLLNRLKNK